MNRTLRHTFFALVVCLPLLMVGVAGAASPVNASGPTPTQLSSDIAKSVQVSQGPDVSKSIPTLAQIGSSPPGYTEPNSQCIVGYPVTATASNPLKTCDYGSTKSSAKVMLLVGDSQAHMWLPAFDVAGKDLGWKVIILAKPSCAPWLNSFKTDYEIGLGITNSMCQRFFKNTIAVAGQIHPAVVVVAGNGGYYGKLGTYPTSAQLTTEMTATIKGFTATGAKVVLMLPFPHFYASETSATPTICLEAHASNITPCLLSPKIMDQTAEHSAMNAVAAAHLVKTIDPVPFVCTTSHCALFVNQGSMSHLVFFDSAHMNLWYSQWIGKAFEPSLTSAAGRP